MHFRLPIRPPGGLPPIFPPIGPPMLPTRFPPAPTSSPGSCNGVPNVDWSCCSSSSPCDVGGGDCDYDSDCSGSLTCGSNNCKRDNSSPGSNWHSNADCCESK